MLHYFTKFLVLLLVLTGSFTSILLADFYVIPVVKKVPNVVHVAPSGGDFNSPIDAMNSITDAGAENRYIIKMDAGTYNLFGSQLVIKPYVSIVGEGQDSTIIRAGIGYSTNNYLGAAVRAQNNTSISSLELHNYSSSDKDYAFTLYCADANVTLENLKIKKSGSSKNSRGLMLKNSYVNAKNIDVDMSEATTRSDGIYLDASTLQASNFSIADTSTNNFSIGIFLTNDSYIDLKDAILGISGGSGENTGILVSTASKISVVDTSINISNGASANYGVHTIVNSSAMLNNVTIAAYDAGPIAIYRGSASHMSVINSSLYSVDKYAKSENAAFLTIANSQLIGSNYTNVVCVDCNNSSELLDINCNVIE